MPPHSTTKMAGKPSIWPLREKEYPLFQGLHGVGGGRRDSQSVEKKITAQSISKPPNVYHSKKSTLNMPDPSFCEEECGRVYGKIGGRKGKE